MPQQAAGLHFLSIDIEEWFLSYDSSQISRAQWPDIESRVEVGTQAFLDLLKTHNTRATFFILGWIAERHPALVQRIAQEGHEIGYHSWDHVLPVNQGPDAFEADLVKGLDILEKLTGKRPVLYRAPMFSLCHESRWAIPLLIKQGIQVSSSYKAHQRINGHRVPPHPFRFEHNGSSLIELPLPRFNFPGLNLVFSGSGYYRLLPESVSRALFLRSPYTMAYFHPRDFDPAVPSTPLLPAYRNWMNRMGNHRTAGRLGRLLTRLPMQPLGIASQLLHDAPLPLIHI